MYRIYAARSSDDVSGDILDPHKCYTRDNAAKRCIDLYCSGFTVHKVVHTSGWEINRDDIERVLKAGFNATKAALHE